MRYYIATYNKKYIYCQYIEMCMWNQLNSESGTLNHLYSDHNNAKTYVQTTIKTAENLES